MNVVVSFAGIYQIIPTLEIMFWETVAAEIEHYVKRMIVDPWRRFHIRSDMGFWTEKVVVRGERVNKVAWVVVGEERGPRIGSRSIATIAFVGR